MATFVMYDVFPEDLAEKVHNLGSDTLKVAATNTAPDATDTNLASISEISPGNGYSSGGVTVAQSSSAQTSGVYKLVIADATLTASGGSMAAFRYLVLINSTANRVIGYYDHGSSVTLADGESFTVDFSATNGVMQIAAAA